MKLKTFSESTRRESTSLTLWFVAWCRKLLREHQLEAVTKVAQQDELERRRRLEQQRMQDFPTPALPEYKSGEKTVVPLSRDTESLTCSRSKPLNTLQISIWAARWHWSGCISSNVWVIWPAWSGLSLQINHTLPAATTNPLHTPPPPSPLLSWFRLKLYHFLFFFFFVYIDICSLLLPLRVSGGVAEHAAASSTQQGAQSSRQGVVCLNISSSSEEEETKTGPASPHTTGETCTASEKASAGHVSGLFFFFLVYGIWACGCEGRVY